MILDFYFLGSWKKEPDEMNLGKEGEGSGIQIHISSSCLSSIKIGLDVTYRTVQGITEPLSEYSPMQKIHFTQIRRRLLSVMKRKKFEPKDDGEPTTVLVDSTGISTTKKGSYIEEM